ncbi:hypothetical protein QM012_009246 [Aureobasidium pullulans]|uniref:Uncharacterized protein n=1 Tax=Aureobasidium pullulans TaxID=5580 RepID=A0ABR0THN8_AURPU
MADEKLTSHKPRSGPPSKLVLHDIGAILSSPTTFPSFANGFLFVATPLVHATVHEKCMLRDDLQIKTVITTWHPQINRYIQKDTTPKTYAIEEFAVEEVLGLWSCYLNLRCGAFAENVMKQLPPKARQKFETDVDRHGVSKADMIRRGQDILWNRDSIDDIFLVLVSSAPLLGRLFNEVLCKKEMYPLLICGDRAMRDSTLIIFLLLLMLDLPSDAIESAYLRITETLPLLVGDSTDAIWAQHLDTAGWHQNSPRWTAELFSRIKTRYGSALRLFTVMGVTEVTRNKIKDVFFHRENKALLDLIDFS